ncbi:HAMP domain-containing sensor histidine kinase [Vallicoccus soli]|uniref:Signal transduction histidine-protein kinase/phosphatase MprB n=1 Tax=Vallicoccus soli TaxID=2339232 RepID=A0A3A3ZHS9_9ACTN|nr:ATP-binding protein [Vallicoccus soli]RJK94856.1 HAMP domain-containing protein [Vallicoccus soli]
MSDLRPLDRLGSIKVKLGLLVAASCAATAFATYYGLVVLGWWPRYTLPVAVLLALAVTQLLAHGMTSPLRELTAAARAMARGDHGRRVAATSRDEVGEAARAFNRMAEDLEDVDRRRRELVANVSHELRTPVAALQAVLENVVDGVTPADPAALGAALAQVQRLGLLVDELLDLSRVDAGQVPLRRTEVPLADLVGAAVAEARLAGRDVAYDVRVDPPHATVRADPARLHQVVANLLDNASRHSPAGGTVAVRASVRDGCARLSVLDEGPGIPRQERELVFERFTRGGTSVAHDGGTGLGLAIARWAVDLHGGRIAVADTERGCRIDVEVPGA